jgi:general secretion pathway protein J
VEVLVALLAMALLAGLAWQGLDSVLRAREASREPSTAPRAWPPCVTQWEQDLQAVHDTGVVPALAFDGQTLRLTRRVEGGVSLVAWSVRTGLWQRWASPPMTRAGHCRRTWLSHMQMQGQRAGHLTVASEASEWQIYFHRGSDWSNAQSSGDLVQRRTARVGPPARRAGGARSPAQCGAPGHHAGAAAS